ncbi:Transmembrane amino acid transporter protein [Geosmithia morbida]|uniref:Transmembrane amino acid transporter protein n=1 Tax=Geosmithia morbida TaxID=1094350 RepID=A0A9P5D9Q4_9HYPO|nr:Transmembrane amino acid transporter protein [Geosmithia morbida]KAF4126769.1 Transmembrane amino acid transporter protein [Geosmithia morbida]
MTSVFQIVTFTSVLIFVVAVTQQQQGRPAAAPAHGEFELGWVSVATPGFAAGITASANIFISGSGSSTYLPVMSEMKRPQDYRKAVYVTGALAGAMYLAFSLVVHRWCGVWLTTPVFSSAGVLFKKVCYGVALPGLVIGVGIYQHIAAKYVFVRALRGSRHLQENAAVHCIVLGVLGFVVAESVPILHYILGLAGSACFAPFSLVFPALLWMHDFDFGAASSVSVRDRAKCAFHILIFLVGMFMVIGGT